MAQAQAIGKVTHYYDKLGVAVVELKKPLASGEMVTFQHGEQVFSQPVTSIQIDHENVKKAKAKMSVGVKVNEIVRPGTVVYRGEVAVKEAVQ